MAIPKTPPELMANCVADWMAGERNIEQIARNNNLHQGTVRRSLREAGIDIVAARMAERKSVSSKVGQLVSNPSLTRLPDPAPEAGGPTLPEPCELDYKPFDTQLAGNWGVIADIHIPYHDLPTIRDWIDDCKRMNVAGILLNGDILDFYQLSNYVRDPSKPRMREEIEKGRQFLEYLRSQFPGARIIWKDGNHDERLKKYLAMRAAEIFDLEDIHLHRLMRAEELGVEWVTDKRIIKVGKLPVIHGHEYPGGGGVMPARWLYLRTGESAMMGHFHQPTFYSFRTITGKDVGMWSLGCACHLGPAYRPLNQWGHGWAIIEVASDRSYHVHQRRRLKSGQAA